MNTEYVTGYFKFKARYITTLKDFLSCPETGEDGMIGSRKSRALSETLADMEEANPLWVERIEDTLADNFTLQS